ncbi:MAG TPA: ROK family protein, partial [Gemmatimonadaceae bacterium]|nr:ROK family protein [Gemmatimonadaceae bacterium]
MRLAGAIDIGGTAIKIGIVDEDGTIIRRERVPTSEDGEPVSLVNAIVATLQPMLDTAKGDKNAASGIGVSVAGFLDPRRLGMIHNANLLALREFPLRRTLEKRFSLECPLEVDSNAAVVAEYRHGAGRDSTRLLGVTLG